MIERPYPENIMAALATYETKEASAAAAHKVAAVMTGMHLDGRWTVVDVTLGNGSPAIILVIIDKPGDANVIAEVVSEAIHETGGEAQEPSPDIVMQTLDAYFLRQTLTEHKNGK